MTDPILERDQLDAALEFAAAIAREYLQRVRDEHVLSPGAEVAIERWSDPMPEQGDGTLTALKELGDRGRGAATQSSGPRFFHFVMGVARPRRWPRIGSTPPTTRSRSHGYPPRSRPG